MKKIQCTLLMALAMAAVFSHPTNARAGILVINSKNIGPYQLSLQGFQSAWSGPADYITLDEQSPSSKTGHDLVVAIGRQALEAALRYPASTPIIFLMTLKVDDSLLQGRSYVGIESVVPLKDFLLFLNKYFPALETVGLISSDPQTTAAADNPSYRPRVVVAQVKAVEEVAAAALELIPKVSAVLLLPDPKVITKETTEFILLKCIEAKKPAVAYAEALVKQGAYLGLVSPYDQMGGQAASIARKGAAALRGRSEMLPPEHIEIFINSSTAAAIGLKIPPQLKDQVKVIQ